MTADKDKVEKSVCWLDKPILHVFLKPFVPRKLKPTPTIAAMMKFENNRSLLK